MKQISKLLTYTMRNVKIILLIAILASCNSQSTVKTAEVDSLKKTIVIKNRAFDSVITTKDSIVKVKDAEIIIKGDSLIKITGKFNKLLLTGTKDANQDKSITALAADIKTLKAQMVEAIQKDSLTSQVAGKKAYIKFTPIRPGLYAIELDSLFVLQALGKKP